jgi:hypothetical protein
VSESQASKAAFVAAILVKSTNSLVRFSRNDSCNMGTMAALVSRVGVGCLGTRFRIDWTQSTSEEVKRQKIRKLTCVADQVIALGNLEAGTKTTPKLAAVS